MTIDRIDFKTSDGNWITCNPSFIDFSYSPTTYDCRGDLAFQWQDKGPLTITVETTKLDLYKLAAEPVKETAEPAFAQVSCFGGIK